MFGVPSKAREEKDRRISTRSAFKTRVLLIAWWEKDTDTQEITKLP